MKISRLKHLLFESTDLIVEAGYGRVLNIKYDNPGLDPNPRILYLGKWRNPNTKNVLLGGINLNYLTDQEIEDLRKNLREILRSGRTLKARWQRGHELLPHIFPGSGFQKGDGAYRTYKNDLVHIKSTGTITPIADKPAPAGPAKPAPKPPAPAPEPTIDRAEQLAKMPEPDLPEEPEVDKIEVPRKPVRVSKKVPEPEPELEPEPEMPAPRRPERASEIQARRIPPAEPVEPEVEPEPELEIKPEDIPMPGPVKPRPEEEPELEEPEEPTL